MQANERLILVVDDQLGVRRLIQEVFREQGYRVVTAANGREAVAMASAVPPAVALIDMKMPVMDGLEALRILKSIHPDTVVLMMTAVGDEDRINEALIVGAHTCISKPFDVFALRKLVEGVLREEGTA